MARPYTITFGLSTYDNAGPLPFSHPHMCITHEVHDMVTPAVPGATTSPAIGSSDQWGSEAAVTVHTACTHDQALDAVRSVLDTMDQDAAYVMDHHAGRAELWYRSEDPRYRRGIRVETL